MRTKRFPFFGTWITKISLSVILIFAGLAIAVPPTTFYFARPVDSAPGSLQSFIDTPIHLSDDPMITLRASIGIDRFGAPSINKDPRAQPSTSYMLPYVYSFLRNNLPGSLSVWSLALVIFCCALASLVIMLWSSSSVLVATPIAFSLLLTSTFRLYSLTGWDNLLQSLPLSIAFVCLVAKKEKHGYAKASLIGLLLSLSFLIRPDSAILAVGILASYFLVNMNSGANSLLKPFISVACFAIPSFVFLIHNYALFGWVTPTTSRLKGSVDLLTSIRYFISNAVTSYSSMSAVLAMIAIFVLYRKKINHVMRPIAISVLFTIVYAFLVADAFPGYRMIWSSAILMSLVLVQSFKPTTDLYIEKIAQPVGMYLAILCIAILASFPGQIKAKIDQSRMTVATGDPANMYIMTQWINSNLKPSDGPLGWFWLGMSYHLPSFEVADFLGKADEAIARMKPLNKDIGHNKYDFSGSINRLRPQAFLHPWGGLTDLEADPVSYSQSRDHFLRNSSNYYALSLLNEDVQSNYDICRVYNNSTPVSSWALVLRKDLARDRDVEGEALKCKSLQDVVPPSSEMLRR